MSNEVLLIKGCNSGLKYIDNDVGQMTMMFNLLGANIQTVNGSSRTIREKLEEMCSGSFFNDNLIIYFTGHGRIDKNSLRLKIAETGNIYQDEFSMTQIKEIIKISKYKKIILILDCCNAETAKKDFVDEDNERFQLFYSSRTLENSYELDQYELSAFTYFICETARKMIKDKNNTITLATLDTYARKEIQRYNLTTTRKIPLPGIWGSKSDLVVLYENDESTITSFEQNFKNYKETFIQCTECCENLCQNKNLWCDIISRYSVELKKFVVPTINTDIGKNMKLNEYFDEWLKNDSSYLALLGDIGVGKSSSCIYLASMAMKSEYSTLVPVFIPLYLLQEIMEKNHDVYDVILYFMNKSFAKEQVFDLIKSKRLILLMDGFDEVSNNSTISGILNNFKQLSIFLRLGCKTLLTCRTHYFSEENQIEDVFKGKVKGTEFANSILNDEYNFSVVELQTFTEDEILDVIKSYNPDEEAVSVWNEIKKIYDLKDLAKRAIILKMILKTLPELKKQKGLKEITSSLLYAIYTKKLIKRELSNKEYQVDLGDVERFIEYIASLMWSNQKLRINTFQFKKEIKLFYDGSFFNSYELEQYIHQSRVASFFIRDKEDNYLFSHKSFFEYYFAKYCVHSLVNSTELIGWNVKWFDKEIANFIRDIIQTENSKSATLSLLNTAQISKDPMVIWNVLHILSLLNKDDIDCFLNPDLKCNLLNKSNEETDSVLLRQYCRVVAKFISRETAEELIDKVIEIVKNDDLQNAKNNDTYYNYYGGKEAACNAFINHLNVERPKYDAKLHVYLLGAIADEEYINKLDEIAESWIDEYVDNSYFSAVEDAKKCMKQRNHIVVVTTNSD